MHDNDIKEQLAKLSDEDLAQLHTMLNDGEQQQTATPTNAQGRDGENYQYRLPDGEVINGSDPVDLAKKVEEYYRRKATPPAQQPAPSSPAPQRQPWDYKKFTELFIQDPRQGLEYLEEAHYGFKTAQVVPALAQVVQTLAAELQQVKEQTKTSYFSTLPEEERAAVQSILQERGWQLTPQAVQDARDIARARGLVQPKQEAQQPQQFVPPRTPRTGPKPPASPEELIARAYDMPLDKLEKFLLENGVITKSAVS